MKIGLIMALVSATGLFIEAMVTDNVTTAIIGSAILISATITAVGRGN